MTRLGDSGKYNFHQMMISSVLYPAQVMINVATRYKDLKNENQYLLQENAKLRLMNDLRIQETMENRRLRNFLRFPANPNYSVRLAQVVARDPNRVNSSVIINLGLKDSVVSGMPVFTPRGLVGRLSMVMNNHSHVQLLYDFGSKVSVMENRSRTIGILESLNARDLSFRFPAHAEVFVGDTIVTSGLGGVFPKGVSVGIVENILEDEVKVLLKARVKLFQNPHYIEEIFVLYKENDQIYYGDLP
jgi:rod shape-determining protein MreC